MLHFSLGVVFKLDRLNNCSCPQNGPENVHLHIQEDKFGKPTASRKKRMGSSEDPTSYNHTHKYFQNGEQAVMESGILVSLNKSTLP